MKSMALSLFVFEIFCGNLLCRKRRTDGLQVGYVGKGVGVLCNANSMMQAAQQERAFQWAKQIGKRGGRLVRAQRRGGEMTRRIGNGLVPRDFDDTE